MTFLAYHYELWSVNRNSTLCSQMRCLPRCARWLSAAADGKQMEMTVKELMATEVVTVRATATMAEASRLLSERQISGAPVVDDEGRPVGVVSRTDLVRGWEQAAAERRRLFYEAAASESVLLPGEPVDDEIGRRSVADVMMPLVFSVQQSDSIRKAAALMSAEGIHRVIVLDGQEIAGLLSASDIVAAVGRGTLVARE
jgi:CBS domain-containing protein